VLAGAVYLFLGIETKRHLYLTMRRGGPYLIALDVSDPSTPQLLWQRDASSPGYGALGQTWSTPKVVKIRGNANPVLVMRAGYDAANEDNCRPLTTVARVAFW
jgi:type IV pilus assembly protein PilY1